MTRFEKALVYALFVLAGISMLLTGRRIEALEQQVKALEMRGDDFVLLFGNKRTTKFPSPPQGGTDCKPLCVRRQDKR